MSSLIQNIDKVLTRLQIFTYLFHRKEFINPMNYWMFSTIHFQNCNKFMGKLGDIKFWLGSLENDLNYKLHWTTVNNIDVQDRNIAGEMPCWL